MATVVDQLIVDVKANTAQATAALGGVQAQVGALSGSIAGLATVGAGLTAGLTAPLVGVGAMGAKAFIDFDAAMNQSLAIMGDVSDEMRGKMTDAAREVAKELPISAEKAAEAYFFLASAGYDAERAIGAMPQVAKFAQAGMFDMATATDLVTDSQSALGMTSTDAAENLKQLTRVTDVFVKANVLSNTSVEQVAAAMTNKAGPALRALGKDIEEGAAVLSAFADQGLKGEAAGTALHIVFRDLQTAALRNSDVFKEMGVAVYDANGEMRHIADIVGDLEGLLGGMSDEQKKATLAQLGFTDKSMGFIQTLLGTSDAIRRYDGELRNATGYVDDVAQKQLETFSAQWQIFKNKLTDIGITIGSVIVPKLGELLDAISPHIEKIGEWVEANDELAVKIGGIVAAIGPVLWILSKVGTAIAVLSSPIGIIVAAIGGLIWWADKMGITFEDVWGAIETFFSVVMGFFKDPDITSDGWVGALEEILMAIQNFVDGIKAWWEDNVESIRVLMDRVKEIIVNVWNDIVAFVQPIVEALFGWLAEEVGKLLEWWGEIWPDLYKVIEMVLGFIQQTWERVWPILQKYVLPILQGIMKAVSGALNVIKGIIQTVLAIITGNWKGAWEGIKKIVGGVWDAIKGVVTAGWNAIKGIFALAGAAIKTAWSAVWLFLGNTVKSVWNGILSFIGSVINKILSKIEGFINSFIDGINATIKTVNKIPGVNVGTIGRVKFPRVNLGHGGEVPGGGMVTVGDRGRPESVYLPRGATVKPLAAGGGGQGIEIHLNAPQNDPLGVAREVGWELIKRGY